MPGPLGSRGFAPQNIEIAVIRADFVNGILRAIPLIEDFLDRVFVPVEAKTDGPFVRFPTGIAIHLEFHILTQSRTALATWVITMIALAQPANRESLGLNLIVS